MSKGVSIYLAIVIMFVLMGIGLGLSTILVGQIRTISRMGNSVTAFYAADTGIEWGLYQDRKAGGLTPGTYYGFLDIDGGGVPAGVCPDALDPSYPGDACYKVTVIAGGVEDCDVGNDKCVQSLGIYQDVWRAIEITF